jgi:transposase
VPHTLVKRQLDVRLSTATVEVFHQGRRVAAHLRSARRGGYATVKEHMPEAHRRYLDWTPERLLRWGRKIGPATGTVIERILAARAHPQQAFNACFGVLPLSNGFGEQRLEAACARALAIGTVRYKSIASILEKGLDRRPWPEPEQTTLPLEHTNLRGSEYYH